MPSVETKRCLAAWIVICFLTIQPACAELEPPPGTQGDDMPLIDDEREQTLDETHRKASEMVVSAAGWLDSFFDDERYLLEENKTRAKRRLSFCYTRFDGFDFSPRVDIRLKLPQLSQKAFLIISSSDDDDFDSDGNPSRMHLVTKTRKTVI